MVVVKVRETYDLHTTQNKMTVIAIHTPKPDIIKKNYPGLLMQCKMYRPISADVRVACASVLPMDPLGVGTSPGDVAPEDVFNPILYKAMSNKGMSQLEARLNGLNGADSNFDVSGPSVNAEINDFTNSVDDFANYYGLLSNTHEWRHANPQSGLEMKNLRPLVYEMVYNVGDSQQQMNYGQVSYAAPKDDGYAETWNAKAILGDAKLMPYLPCTSYTLTNNVASSQAASGFDNGVANCATDVPYLNVVCGCIIVPPSRLHSLYFRMVVEWDIEFTRIRPIGEISSWYGLGNVGLGTHFQSYSYSSAKEAITGSSDTVLENDTCMVSSNADLEKVM